MTPQLEKERVKKPLLRLPFFLILTLVFVSVSVSAVKIDVYDFKWADSPNVGDRFYQVKVKVTATGQTDAGNGFLGYDEQGIVELNLAKDANTPFLAVAQSREPCAATFPWNVHTFYGLLKYESVTFTLTGRGIPDGTFYPVITHATGCFKDGAVIKEPYGWGKRITSFPVVFGSSTGNLLDQCDTPYTALQWVKGKGDVACKEAVCDNPASTSSVARCVRKGVCADGADQWTSCPDGSSFAARTCSDGAWKENTGRNCPIPAEPPAATPELVKASLGLGGGGGNLGFLAILSGIGVFGFFLLKKFGLVKF